MEFSKKDKSHFPVFGFKDSISEIREIACQASPEVMFIFNYEEFCCAHG